LYYHPYKIEVTQELSARDKTSGLFPGRLISRFGDITWPAPSPDIPVPAYFLWGYVKNKVYENILVYSMGLQRIFLNNTSHNLTQLLIMNLSREP
jgi:hypothetical protein